MFRLDQSRIARLVNGGERSDEAIQGPKALSSALDCFAALAMMVRKVGALISPRRLRPES
jgi:hypothetical protein